MNAGDHLLKLVHASIIKNPIQIRKLVDLLLHLPHCQDSKSVSLMYRVSLIFSLLLLRQRVYVQGHGINGHAANASGQ